MAGKAGPEGSWVYEWTCDNKMERAEKDGALEAEYAYDYRGERIRKTTPGESVNYLVDNNNRAGYSQVARETDGSGAELAAYAFGDDLISQTRAGAVSFFHYDGLGSTRALTSIAGDVTDAVTYLAFGQILARTGTTEFSHLFTGEAYDFNIGHYYLRARLYDPVNGIFASLDPFEGAYSIPQSLQKYLYAFGNSVNLSDPSGNMPSLISLIVALSIITILATSCTGTNSKMLSSLGIAYIHGQRNSKEDLLKALQDDKIKYVIYVGHAHPGDAATGTAWLVMGTSTPGERVTRADIKSALSRRTSKIKGFAIFACGCYWVVKHLENFTDPSNNLLTWRAYIHISFGKKGSGYFRDQLVSLSKNEQQDPFRTASNNLIRALND